MEDTYTRLIDTKVPTTEVNKEIFDSVTGQISDGIWENSPGMDSYWNDVDIRTEGDTVILAIDYRHEIPYTDTVYKRGDTYHVTKWRNNRYARMTDKQVLNFFKNKVRTIVKIEDKDNLELSSMSEYDKVHKYYFSESYKIPAREDFSWRADNNTVTDYLDREIGVTVGDAYKLVKILEKA